MKMTVGRLEEHWKGNCLCIGLSQGFIEPLEATALMLVQYALHHFIDCWQSNNSRREERYNSEINRMFDGIRDYIAAHYYLNTRDDSAYWVACREDLKVPDTLSYLLNAWDKGASFEQALNEAVSKSGIDVKHVNVGIAGHRTTYGAPFRDLDDVNLGDAIQLTIDSSKFHYIVDQIDIVEAIGGEYVLYDRGDDRLTLTTCHPKYSASQRLIVSAILVKIESVN